MWTEESQAIRTSLPSSLGACHLPERDGAPSSGLWSEPRNRRRAGLGLDGHCPVLCTFTGLSFRLGVLLPAETGVGGSGVGNIPRWAAWTSGCGLCSRGKKPLVSRFRSDYSSLAVCHRWLEGCAELELADTQHCHEISLATLSLDFSLPLTHV